MMPSCSSIATLAQTSNSTACFTSAPPNTWVINSGASDHMTEDKNILSTLSVSSLLPVTLADSQHFTLKVIESSTVNSLSETYQLFYNIFPNASQNQTTRESKKRSL